MSESPETPSNNPSAASDGDVSGSTIGATATNGSVSRAEVTDNTASRTTSPELGLDGESDTPAATPTVPAVSAATPADQATPAEPIAPVVTSATPVAVAKPAPLPAPPAHPMAPAQSSEAPAAEAGAPVDSPEPEVTSEFGRATSDGTVYVSDNDQADGWREVGQYPDASPAEALAYFERKFTDLASQVALLEQRAHRGTSAADIAKSVKRLRGNIAGANAVGDLVGLQKRLDVLGGEVEELNQQQVAEAQAALEATRVEREAIVQEVEKLAAQDPAHIQWKRTSTALDELFNRWQTHQQEHPRLPKSEADELWKRFRAARGTLDQHRKAFFAELDAQHRDAKTQKLALIERAEALLPQGADGIPAYRELLDKWKQLGRAGRRDDDVLWARFKEAGDAVYQAKAAIVAVENEEYAANLKAKLALLEEAEPLLAATDHDTAKTALNSIQRRWDEIGRVPREQMHTVEDRLRKVENAVRKLDEEHWRATNPEKKARSAGLAAQLIEAIERLEAERDEAERSGNQAAVTDANEAIEARRAWLNALN